MVRKIRKRSSLFHTILFLPVMAVVTLSGVEAFSQQQNKQKEIFAIGAGAGVLTFHGDVGKGSLGSSYSFIRSGYSLSAEKFLGRNLSVSFNLLNGKIVSDEKSSDNLPKRNFESFISQKSFCASFFFRGKKEQLLIPYFSTGIGFLTFSPSTDLKDKNNVHYHYWKDGSIKDLPDTGMNYFYAQNIERDYNYESSLTDSNDFSLHVMAIPVSCGVKIKLNPATDMNLGFSYTFSTSDYLDGLKSGGNDKYLFTTASLTWHIFTLPKEEKEKISSIDYAGIDKT